mmetsp:Transcript_37248/g.104590  ORF Transcript_37248/g.104590 Transcript_37248/m.104590 type:complete len:366 (+) Transcript_37248:91-1188(+)
MQMASNYVLVLLVHALVRISAAVNLGYLSSASTAAPTPDKRPTATPKNAWIWNMHAKGDTKKFMYDPVILTLGEALRDYGANVTFVSKDNLESDEHRNALLDDVTATVARGQKPLIVALAFWFTGADQPLSLLRKCRGLGAFVVFYQTEPDYRKAFQKFKSKCDGLCDEIWDYSHANLDNYPESWRRVKNRYVPPGYARALDFGVSVAKQGTHVKNIAFLGQWGVRRDYRGAPLEPLYREVFGTKLVSKNDIHTAEDFTGFFTEYPVQLVTYRNENCCPSTNVLLAFRMAQLISNRACVISPPAYPRDEEEWHGIVHFAERSHIANLFDEKSRDVSNCQKQSFDKFKNKFKPLSILKRSGFFDVW